MGPTSKGEDRWGNGAEGDKGREEPTPLCISIPGSAPVAASVIKIHHKYEQQNDLLNREKFSCVARMRRTRPGRLSSTESIA